MITNFCNQHFCYLPNERHIGKVGPGTRDPWVGPFRTFGTLRVGPIGWDPSGGTHPVGPIDLWHYTCLVFIKQNM